MKAKAHARTGRAAFVWRPAKWRWLLGAAGPALAAAALLLATGPATRPEPAPPDDAGLSAAAASAEAPPPMGPERSISASAQPSPGDGPTAPDFSIVTTNGKTFRLSEQRGKVVVVNFNATG